MRKRDLSLIVVEILELWYIFHVVLVESIPVAADAHVDVDTDVAVVAVVAGVVTVVADSVFGSSFFHDVNLDKWYVQGVVQQAWLVISVALVEVALVEDNAVLTVVKATKMSVNLFGGVWKACFRISSE